MSRRIKATAAVMAVLLMAFTSACGKRGALEAPEGSIYPRSYPAPEGFESPDEPEAGEEERQQ